MGSLKMCIHSILKHCNGRVSPRLSLYEQLEKAIELYYTYENHPMNKDTVTIISSLISIKYAENPNSEWNMSMLQNKSSKSTHSMVRRSQSTV